jgi:2,3-bisphosphoglycerate-independent phosphoglycerate mutase
MIYGSNYYDHNNDRKKNIYFVTMMNYEGIVPSSIAFPPEPIINPLGKVLEDNNLSQARIAETEKYAHVTFFFDGGIEVNYKNEKKIICPSPKVATYDLKPEMSAYEVCDEILNEMNTTDVIIANFANGDMVGHTGNLNAAIKAVEVVDECVGMIYDKSQQTNSTLFITADHGNADVMMDEKGGPFTSHTTNRVPFVITDDSVKMNKIGKLSNIAPTILKYLNVSIPAEMDEESLI